MATSPIGIVHTQAVISDLGSLIVDAVKIVKGGLSIGAFQEVLKIIGDVKTLLSDAPQAFPELKALDAAEAVALSEAAYGLVQSVVAAIVG